MDLSTAGGVTAVMLIAAVSLRTAVQTKRARSQKKAEARAQRYGRKLRDHRDNMGGRIMNALKEAARESSEGLFTVEGLNAPDRYWIFVMRLVGKRRVQFLMVGVALSGTGFDVTVRDDSWSRDTGPAEFIVDEVIPKLAAKIRRAK